MRSRNERFAVRVGAQAESDQLQLNGIDAALSMRLWNTIYARELRLADLTHVPYSDVAKQSELSFGKAFWREVMLQPGHKAPAHGQILVAKMYEWWAKASWLDVYGAIEWMMEQKSDNAVRLLRDAVNEVLVAECSGYRVVNRLVVAVTDQLELDALRDATARLANDPFANSRLHVANGCKHAFSRENADYANAVKEAVCGVEVALGVAVGDAEAKVGKALALLERDGVITGALKVGWNGLYGFASEEGGIRHGRTDDRQATFADAKYFLVSASAFVNWLAGQAAERGLPMVKARNATVSVERRREEKKT